MAAEHPSQDVQSYEKPSFIEEKDQVNTESLSMREAGLGLRVGNNFRKQEKETMGSTHRKSNNLVQLNK